MAYNPYSLSGKTIFITGASSGIGRATAVECSKLEARMVITARNKERLQETFSQLEGEGHEQVTADLSRPDEILELVKSLPELDGFVNNAGMIKLLPVRYITEDDLEQILQLNTVAPVLLTHHLVNSKKMKKPSSIVFTSSIAGVYNSSPGNSMYSASKGALHGFMKNSALELASKNIRCNSVNPGMVHTSLSKMNKLTQEQYNSLEEKYPLQRFGKPEDIAFAIIYLLSDASGWVTGTSLLIDGGFTLH